MIRSILTLVAISAFLYKIDAQIMCSVGESGEAAGNFCNAADPKVGDAQCAEYCKKKFGAELLKAACSAERPGGNKKRECVCSLKCANGGCWGDPHCWSFDNTKFGYQNLKKYYVVKPCKAFPTLPEFEIMQSNRPWGPGPMSVLDTMDFVVPDFGQMVTVTVPKAPGQPYVATINRKPITIPHRFSRFVKHREDFIDFAFGDVQHLNLVITTSFGLRITISIKPTGAAAPYTIYSDISVDIPRHPEMRGNTCGILGLWDDNPKNDNIDSKGKPQPLDDAFSHAFGDSWLVPGSGLPSECELELARKAHEDHVKHFNKEHRERLTKLCKANLDRPNMHDCLKHLDRPMFTITNCVMDLSHMPDEASQQAFLKAMVAKMDQACPHIDIQFKEPVKDCCLDNLVPLYRFYHPPSDDHFYTTSLEETVGIVQRGYKSEGIPGYVAINGADCKCSGESFKPVYRNYGGGGAGGRPGNRDDHFYTANLEESNNANAKLAYNKEGIGFYGSTVADHCGATVPLYRTLRGFDHFYTTNKAERDAVVAAGGKDEGITIYIWPAKGAVKQ